MAFCSAAVNNTAVIEKIVTALFDDLGDYLCLVQAGEPLAGTLVPHQLLVVQGQPCDKNSAKALLAHWEKLLVGKAIKAECTQSPCKTQGFKRR